MKKTRHKYKGQRLFTFECLFGTCILRDMVSAEMNARNKFEIGMPNFMGTGMMLCGILKPGESVKKFTKRKYKS